MTSLEFTTPESIDEKNKQFIQSTEDHLNQIFNVLDVPGISVKDLSLDDASEIRRNLDPRFDGGQMKSRQIINEQGASRLPDELAEIIFEYAELNNMTYGSTEFLPGPYDAVCSLGGANKTPYDRAKSILEAIESGKISTKLVVFSGSPRKISDAEKQKSSGYAPGAETEADLARGALNSLKQEYADLLNEQGIDFEVLETAEGTYTATEIEQLIQHFNLPKDSRIGLQTTQIYQPFTQLEASAVGYGKGIEIIVAGHASSESVVASRKPETYLSELTRALLSSVRLIESKK